jgi:hypothetical protein
MLTKPQNDLVFIYNEQGKIVGQGHYNVSRWAFQHKEGRFFVLTREEVRNLPKKRDGRQRKETLKQRMIYRISRGVAHKVDPFYEEY